MLTTIVYPINRSVYDPRLLEPDGMAAFAQAAEAGGFDAIAFTDHPAPPTEWMKIGAGHDSLDPLTALSFVAAHTSRIRLMTYLLVLPYRHPLITLKAATTLDRLSGGRVTLTVGAGYLRSEFSSLGVNFEARNELLGEGIEVLRNAWPAPEFRHEGLHYPTEQVTVFPRPVQSRVPILIGGNSRAARQRAAHLGDGWSPLLNSPEESTRNRTAAISTIPALGNAISQLRAEAADAGRNPADLMVQVDSPRMASLHIGAAAEEHLDVLGQLREADVQSVVLQPPGQDLDKCLEEIAEYAATVMPALHS